MLVNLKRRTQTCADLTKVFWSFAAVHTWRKGREGKLTGHFSARLKTSLQWHDDWVGLRRKSPQIDLSEILCGRKTIVLINFRLLHVTLNRQIEISLWFGDLHMAGLSANDLARELRHHICCFRACVLSLFSSCLVAPRLVEIDRLRVRFEGRAGENLTNDSTAPNKARITVDSARQSPCASFSPFVLCPRCCWGSREIRFAARSAHSTPPALYWHQFSRHSRCWSPFLLDLQVDTNCRHFVPQSTVQPSQLTPKTAPSESKESRNRTRQQCDKNYLSGNKPCSR